ncbi:MAG: 5-oxoprolinase subunit PxpA [Chitinophagales bacterium]
MNVDLNCDMGEGMKNDKQLMPLISSTNIACGYHAGDEDTMKMTVESALQHHVAIGAHPGFADKEFFGRRELNQGSTEIYDLVISQINTLKKITTAFHTSLHHVKPHGALYNLAAREAPVARMIARAVYDLDPQLILYGLSGSYLVREAAAFGLHTASEVFADRTYQDNGQLTPRSESNAVIDSEEKSIAQVLQMIQEKTVTSIHSIRVPIVAQTICIHGDGKRAVTFAKNIVEALKQQQVEIKTI